MTYFTRWYTQPVITKIESNLANKIYDERIAAAFPLGHQFNGIEFIQLATLTDEGQQPTFKQLTDDADDIFPDLVQEIYHCNIKFPISQIKEIWGIEEFNAGSYVSAVAEDKGGFLGILRNKIMEDFVSFEELKISKVGRFLKNDKSLRLYIDGEKLPIDNNAGVALFETIKRSSDIFLSGKYHIDTGAEDAGSLIYFQAIIFLPIRVTETKQIKIEEQIYAGTVNYVGSEGPTSDDQANLAGVTTYGLNFIREVACEPVPKKERKPREDDPEAETKKSKLTAREVKQRKLTKQQKQDISKKVKAKLLQVSDSAFLNALLNADKIKTTRDAFDFVLNVLPLQSIMGLAIDCLKKYIPAAPDVVVCDIIMRNLSNEDLKKILRYANANVNTNTVARAFKTEVISKFNESVEDDPAGFKAFVLKEFNDNLGTKEIICAMVFLALPAAITLLALYTKEAFGSRLSEAGVCVEPLTPPEIETRKLLENPARKALTEIEAGLKSHPILSFTKNLSDNLLRQIISFVDKIIVESVSIMLQELAYLCDGSSASDFANAPSQTPPFDSNINDLLVDKDDDAVYDDLFNFVFDENPGSDVDKLLIKDFFLDLADLLTLSEICILMSGDPNDIRYNLVVDKIYYGLLALDKYAPLKAVLNTRQKLINFINVFAARFDQVACNNKIEELTKSKKMLSDLCNSTNSAYVDDLKNKAAENAIEEMLDQEDGLLNDLLDAIKNLATPQTPEIFCGPSATFKGAEPLLESFQDPSQIHLSKKSLTSILKLASRTFEGEVDNFKTSLTRSATDLPNMISTISKIMSTGYDVSEAMAKAYDIDPKDEDGNSFFNTNTQDFKEKLQKYAAGNKLIAQRVNDLVSGISDGSNLDVSIINTSFSLVISISTGWQPGNKQLRYFAHYEPPAEFQQSAESAPYNGSYIIPGFDTAGAPPVEAILPFGETRLIYSSADNPVVAIYSGLLPNNASNKPLQGSGIFDDVVGANRERASAYKTVIKQTVEDSPNFFGEILERIIIEHAEFITANDLFKKEVFNRINFSKTNICDPSLLYFNDIVGKMESRIKGIECKVGYGSIPTPAEIVQIVSLYEATIRVVTLTEMMKMLFVFVSFGIETLLPEINDDIAVGYSFYFNYLVEKIQQRMDELIPAEFSQSVDRAVNLVGANDLSMDLEDVEETKILQLFVFSSIKIIQAGFLNRLKNAGIKTKIDDSSQSTPQLIGNSDDDEKTGVFLDSMYSDPSSSVLYEQILRNVIPAEKELSVLSPPNIIKVNTEKRESIIPKGFYSNNPRLRNGGFFIEKGFEIFNNRVLDPSLLKLSFVDVNKSALTPENLLTMISILPTENGPIGEPTNNSSAWLIDLTLHKSTDLLPKDVSNLPDVYWKKLHVAKNMINLLGIAKSSTSNEVNLLNEQTTSGLNLFKTGEVFGEYAPFAPPTAEPDKIPDFVEEGDFGSTIMVDNPAYIEDKQREQYNYLYLIQKYLFGAEEYGPERRVLSSMFNAVSPGQQFYINELESLSTLSLLCQKQGRLRLQDSQVKGGLLHIFDVAQYFSDLYIDAIKYSYNNNLDGLGFNPAELLLKKQKSIISTLKELLTINTESPEFVLKTYSLKPGENYFYDTEEEGVEFWMNLGFMSTVAANIVAGNYVPDGYEAYADGAGPYADSANPAIAQEAAFIEKEFNDLILLLGTKLSSLDSYFYKFGKYITFNLLIRLDESGENATIVNSLKANLEIISLNMNLDISQGSFPGTTKNVQSYVTSVLEKKYFLREEDGDLYFKLPLVYKHASIENKQQYEEQILNAQEDDNILSIDNEFIVASFAALFESIPYKDLLSFLSILVTEVLSDEYPSLNDIFKNTIRTLGTGTKQSLQASDRINNPNLYESQIDAEAYNNPRFSNPDLLSSFFEGIFKGVANMTDPTWRTPWFLPGPLTPFGIIAKLLEGEDDEGVTPEEAAQKTKDETDTSNSYDCPDDKTNSDN